MATDITTAVESGEQSLVGAQPSGKPRALNVPIYYVSAFRVQSTGNDLTVVLQRTLPLETESGAILDNAIRLTTEAALVMSLQSAKDLMVLLRDQILQLESALGEIKTPYLIELNKNK